MCESVRQREREREMVCMEERERDGKCVCFPEEVWWREVERGQMSAGDSEIIYGRERAG